MTTPESSHAEPGLRLARSLAARGDDAAARERYMEVLRGNPACVAALVELAVLADSGGYRSAARTALTRAIGLAPGHHVARVALGNLLADSGEHQAACHEHRAALAANPAFAPAHQGLARSLAALGDARAEVHFERGFRGHAVTRWRHRGAGQGIPLLLLAAARGGNVPWRNLIDDRCFATTVLFADFADPRAKLPAHALLVNAIGDADAAAGALEAATGLLAGSLAPVINPPSRVAATGRAENARRLGAIPGVVAPRVERRPRGAPPPAAARFPLLLRSPGFHTGQNFLRVDAPGDFAAAAAALPGEELLVIEYLDARGADGLARKYRVMIIDGAPYPLHLAIGADWKQHYFTSDMACSPAHRAEEAMFLADMKAVLGRRALAALRAIGQALGLDYAGIDFALTPSGDVLLFEANATMLIDPAPPGPLWDYRRPAIAAAQAAARAMLRRRATA